MLLYTYRHMGRLITHQPTNDPLPNAAKRINQTYNAAFEEQLVGTARFVDVQLVKDRLAVADEQRVIVRGMEYFCPFWRYDQFRGDIASMKRGNAISSAISHSHDRIRRKGLTTEGITDGLRKDQLVRRTQSN